MNANSYKIWTNASFPEDANAFLREKSQCHTWLTSATTSSLNLVTSPADPKLAEASIAFGQPDASQLMQLKNIRWVHLTSAGYTAYDRDDLRDWFRSNGTALTTSSGVYDEPCAQHVVSMLMAFARQLPYSLRTQHEDRSWPAATRRANSFLLSGQRVVIFGFGEIGKRLAELLSPFQMQLVGVRRNPRGDESIPIVSIDQSCDLLGNADHIINVLPANESTNGFFHEGVIRRMKPGAFFYNIGRGSTVSQEALIQALNDQHLAGAYLDVTSPEPLPPDHPLWFAKNCFITPHTAGGFREEMLGLVEHFLSNLERYSSGLPLLNRVI